MKKILILCTVAAVGLASCVNDKGNYDYGPKGGVSFKQLTDEERIISTQVGEELVITPELIYDNPDAGDTFTYQWGEIPVTNLNMFLPIGEPSNDPVLHLRVPDDQERHYLLRVQNNRTGAWYMMNRNASYITVVTNPLSKGFLLLVQKDENEFNIDMLINNENGFEPIMHDMLSLPTFEEDRFPTTGTAKQLVTFNNTQSRVTGLPAWAIFVLSDQNCGIVHNTSFAKGATLKETLSSFSAYWNDGDFVPEKIITTGASGGDFRSATFYYQDNWYWMSNHIGYRWENPVNILFDDYLSPKGREIPVAGDKVMLLGGYGNNTNTGAYNMMIMWSEDHDKFLVKTGNGNILSDRRNTLTSKWLVDIDVAGEADLVARIDESTGDNFKVEVAGREVVNMGVHNMNTRLGGAATFLNTMGYAVVKDPDAYRYIILRVNISDVQKGECYDFPANTQVGNAKFFATSPAWSYYYFANGSDVYAFRLNELKSEMKITQAKKITSTGTEMIDIVPPGEEIVIFKSTASENSGFLDNNALIVVTRNTTTKACRMRVYQNRVEDANESLTLATYKKVVDGVESNEPMEFTDLGNVVDVSWKAN